jgi:hypothetical protein
MASPAREWFLDTVRSHVHSTKVIVCKPHALVSIVNLFAIACAGRRIG